MTTEQLEQVLGVNLPEPYRRSLNEYPSRLAELNYFDDPKHGGPSDFEFMSNPKRLLEINQQNREFWPESDYADTPLPESYFLIGEDGGGDLFAIDTANTESCPVFHFDHEEGEWNKRADSLEEFAEQLIEMAKNLK